MATLPKLSMSLPTDWQHVGRAIRPDGVVAGGLVTLLGGRGVRLAGSTTVWVAGFEEENPNNLDLTSPVNGSVNPRYDRLIAEYNATVNTITFKILSGPAAVAPSNPPLTRNLAGVGSGPTLGIWQYSIAYWLVPGTGGPGVSNYGLVLEGLRPSLDPVTAYAGNPIFLSTAERDSAYIAANLGAMIDGMQCTVQNVEYFYANGGWAQKLPPYGPVVVATIANAIGLGEGTVFYGNDADRLGIVTSGGPNYYLQGVVRQVLSTDYIAPGTALSGTQNIMTQPIDVLQHSLVEYQVGVCIKTTGDSSGTLTIGLTGAPSRTITWNSHTLSTLIFKELTIKVRVPGNQTVTATLSSTITGGTGITLWEVPWVIREIT